MPTYLGGTHKVLVTTSSVHDRGRHSILGQATVAGAGGQQSGKKEGRQAEKRRDARPTVAEV